MPSSFPHLRIRPGCQYRAASSHLREFLVEESLVVPRDAFVHLDRQWTLTQGNADSEFTWDGAGMNWLPVSGDFTLD